MHAVMRDLRFRSRWEEEGMDRSRRYPGRHPRRRRRRQQVQQEERTEQAVPGDDDGDEVRGGGSCAANPTAGVEGSTSTSTT
jgi:hypothetical protein